MIDNFERLLNEAISVGVDSSAIRDVLTLVDKLKTTKALVAEMEEELAGNGETLCAVIAHEVRKLLSKVETKLSRNGCTLTYKARSVTISPNFETATWTVTPGGSARDKQLLAPAADKISDLPLDQYPELARVLAQLFVGRYKTLQGGKVGPYETPTTPEEDEVPDSAIDQAVEDSAGDMPEPATPEGDAPTPGVEGAKPGVVPYA